MTAWYRRGLLDSRQGSGFYVADSPLASCPARGWSDPSLAEDLSDHILEQFNHPSSTLKLAGGFVPETWRDIEGLTQAIRAVSRNEIDSVIHYATPMGHPELRRQVLHRVRQLGIAAELPQVLITTGASQALDLVVRTLAQARRCGVRSSRPGVLTTCSACCACRTAYSSSACRRPSSGPDPDATEALPAPAQAQAVLHQQRAAEPDGLDAGAAGCVPAAGAGAPPRLPLCRGRQPSRTSVTHFTDRLATLDQLEHADLHRRVFQDDIGAAAHRLRGRRQGVLVKDLVDVKSAGPAWPDRTSAKWSPPRCSGAAAIVQVRGAAGACACASRRPTRCASSRHAGWDASSLRTSRRQSPVGTSRRA
ncbi:hypothetical protein ACTMU2_06435 [Cupriavidus basilensis]